MTVDLNEFGVEDFLSITDSLGQKFTVKVVDYDPFDNAVKLRLPDGEKVWFMPDGYKHNEEMDLNVYIVSATKINKDNKTMKKIDLYKDIAKGSVVTLSDGSSHVHRYTSGVRHNVNLVHFVDGLAVEVNNSGQSPYENGVSIVGIEPPKPLIDLSTVGIGDVCVTRDGYEVPWTNIVKGDTNAGDPYMIFSSGGSYDCVTQKGYFCIAEDAVDNRDIVEIRRASPEQKADLAKNWTIG